MYPEPAKPNCEGWKRQDDGVLGEPIGAMHVLASAWRKFQDGAWRWAVYAPKRLRAEYLTLVLGLTDWTHVTAGADVAVALPLASVRS